MKEMTFKILISGLLLGTALGAYMLLVEPFQIKIVKREVVTAKWTYDRPLTLALIADVHGIWPWMDEDHIRKIVEKTNSEKPDLVLLLGDYVATHPFGLQLDPDSGVAPYTSFDAPCGVYAVLGNHDLHKSVGWPEALKRAGVNVLENRSVKVSCDNRDFWVSGLEDFWWRHPDVPKTLKQVTDTAPVILAMHNPDSFVTVPPSVTLSVAGHTHAGQIHIPFLGAVQSVIPSRYGMRFYYGHIQEDGKDLIVSGGLGTTAVPLRFLNPPEIVIVELRQ